MRAASIAARPALLAAVMLAFAAMTGCSPAPATSAGGGTPTAPTSQSPSSTGAASPGTTSPAPIAPATQPASTSPASRYPAGGSVPLGFAADSVTFVSTQEAFVLGTAPCAHAQCTSILRTLNRGATWRGLPAPAVPIGRPNQSASSQAWGIRFATPLHGFVFGNGLWVTTDGGAHWTPIAYPGGHILSLATIDGQVLALTAPLSSSGTGTETLYRRPLGGGAWQLVTRVRSSWTMDPTDMIATQAGVAAVLDTSSVMVTTNGGLTYARRALPRLPSGGYPYAPAVVAPTGSGGLALVCTGEPGMSQVDKVVYTSADLGAHWVKAGTPSRSGYPYAIAAGAPGTLVIATSSAASWLFGSRDGAASWTVTTEPDGGMGWADLGFTTASHAVVIHGPVYTAGNPERRPGQLMLSSNGGATWYPVSY